MTKPVAIGSFALLMLGSLAPHVAYADAFTGKGIPQLYVISAAGKIVCDTHDVAEAVAAVDAELKKR